MFDGAGDRVKCGCNPPRRTRQLLFKPARYFFGGLAATPLYGKMNTKINILILAIIFVGCSASEQQHEYTYGTCGHSIGQRPIYGSSVKLLELYPSDVDSTIIPPEITIDRDSLASMVFYPPIAIRAGVEGIVVAQFLVDTRGYTKNIKITRGILTMTDYSVNNVLCMTKFRPAKKNGIAVKCEMTAKFEFSRGEIIGWEDW